MATIKSKVATTSSGETAIVKSGSKAEAKYKAQGATFSNDPGTVRAAKDASKAATSIRTAADPYAVAENMGIDVPDKITAEEAPAVQANLAAQGAVPTPLPSQIPEVSQLNQNALGASTPGSVSHAPTPTQNKYQTAAATMNASGVPAPMNAGEARSMMAGAIPPTQDTTAVDAFVGGDAGVNSLLQGITQLLNPPKQTTTLMQDYKKLYKQSGLDEINEELIDADTVINGTEDDIRNEIQTAGGFGTDSQVQAMALSRNKNLLKRYNQLVQMKTDATNQLNTMMSLNAQDKEMAQKKIDSQINTMFQLANFRQQAQNNVREQARWLTTTMGADGVYDAYKSDPRQLAFLEKTLGVAPGGLASMASKAATDRALETQMKQAQLAAQYSSIETDRLQQQKLRAELALSAPNELGMAQQTSNINTLQSLAKDPGISAAVGTSFLSRSPDSLVGKVGKFFATAGIGTLKDVAQSLTGSKQNFIASVEQFREQLTLDKLQQAKANGATFGALSDGERTTLAAAASKLGSWAVKNSAGQVVGYNTSEKNFKKELDTINNFQKLDAIIKGADPAAIGVVVQPDGSYWTQNSDGSVTRLR